MFIEKIYFDATDNLRLFGVLHKSEGPEYQILNSKKEVVLSVHGMTSNCFKKREDIFAKEFTDNGIDYFCFNNRGADIIGYYEKIKDEKLVGRIEAGSAKENFTDCYHDIKGAILMLLSKGYEVIYLQGHSLGSAKSVYTYKRLKQENEIEILKHIKGVTLLSIVDIPRVCRALLWDKYNLAIEEAEKMVQQGNEESLITREHFLHPLSAKNFLFINQIDGEIDLAPFGATEPNFSALNNIECKLFMCWGKEKDMILQSPEELEEILKSNVKNKNFEIKFIEETGHNYHFKEKETAQEILKFLKRDGGKV